MSKAKVIAFEAREQLLQNAQIYLESTDALILSLLLVPDCTEIYTTDLHLELYQKKGVINLHNLTKM